MDLPLAPPLEPMEAEQVAELPAGDGWQYEPKWDGFRCLAFRDRDEVELQSKAGKPLGRYFPDVVEHLRRFSAQRFVLDGELVIGVGGALSFDQLQLRLHPAASRVEMLAAEHPAALIAFDLLMTERRTVLLERPLHERRERLERFWERYGGVEGVDLSPADVAIEAAQGWMRSIGPGLDGVIAKRLDMPYRSGERDGMVKIKNVRTADCVVGAFRYASGGKKVGSLLLGLYGEDGKLHHVGYTSSIGDSERAELTARLEALSERGDAEGFDGRSPDAPSRWNRGKETRRAVPLPHELVVEVGYDHVSGGRFRHGTKLARWRPDKAPRQCTMQQIERPGLSALSLLGR